MKQKKKKQTFGKIALDLQEKELLENRPLSINELAHNILHGNADGTTEGDAKGMLQRVWEEACDAMKTFGTDSCFIEVRWVSTGRLGHNSTNKKFFGRRTCPTPTYNQDVFRVINTGEIEYLWSLPTVLDAYMLLAERHKLILDPEYGEAVKMVMDFCDGTLHKLVQQFDAEYEQPVKGIA